GSVEMIARGACIVPVAGALARTGTAVAIAQPFRDATPAHDAKIGVTGGRASPVSDRLRSGTKMRLAGLPFAISGQGLAQAPRRRARPQSAHLEVNDGRAGQHRAHPG